MGTKQLQRPNNPMYKLLRKGKFKEFNKRREEGDKFNLAGLDLRAFDLRGLDTRGITLADAYLRNANLSGLNLLGCPMDGASIHDANISGVFFPSDITSDEIRLSIKFGTRMRIKE